MRFPALAALVAISALICALPGSAAMAAATAANGAGPAPAARPAAASPNIVLILADDFASNLASPARLADSMPNLGQMMRDGVTFSNYFVTDSLCCPSRSSIFTGKFPHNTGVFSNTPPQGGYTVFIARGNEAHTFALALQGGGYSTAMMGKYLNGYQPGHFGVSPGWNQWDVAGDDGYNEFDYKLNENGAVLFQTRYLTDVISHLGQDFIGASAGGPFLIEIATFAPHLPYIPATRDANHFPGLTYERNTAYGARPDSAAPTWLQKVTPLSADDMTAIDTAYRMRVQSDQAIDRMIGEVRAELAAAGLDKNTYLIFSSDNGYHMGEYSLRPGKMTPFDTDVRVPLVIVGPNVPSGVTINEIVQNIDLAPTFTDIGGVGGATLEPDGKSLLPLIAAYASGSSPPPWRHMALIEHRRPPNDVKDPDHQEDLQMGDPATYEALRFNFALYVEYHDPLHEIGYYNLLNDPFELHNVAAGLTADRLARLHDILLANTACVGAAACWAAQRMRP